jgi:hypothetical protein
MAKFTRVHFADCKRKCRQEVSEFLLSCIAKLGPSCPLLKQPNLRTKRICWNHQKWIQIWFGERRCMLQFLCSISSPRADAARRHAAPLLTVVRRYLGKKLSVVTNDGRVYVSILLPIQYLQSFSFVAE